jgi:hypothetical protein
MGRETIGIHADAGSGDVANTIIKDNAVNAPNIPTPNSTRVSCGRYIMKFFKILLFITAFFIPVVLIVFATLDVLPSSRYIYHSIHMRKIKLIV